MFEGSTATCFAVLAALGPFFLLFIQRQSLYCSDKKKGAFGSKYLVGKEVMGPRSSHP